MGERWNLARGTAQEDLIGRACADTRKPLSYDGLTTSGKVDVDYNSLNDYPRASSSGSCRLESRGRVRPVANDGRTKPWDHRYRNRRRINGPRARRPAERPCAPAA